MRKKFLSKTYLKGVEKYNIYMYLNEDKHYVCVKEIIKIDKPFISKSGVTLIDNGYYIIEILPKAKNYAVRIFLNPKKEKLLYYFDITLVNGVDLETLIPFYSDLYLDVVFANDEIHILDEDELESALSNNKISVEEYSLAIKQKDILVKSLIERKNEYLNINTEKYLK